VILIDEQNVARAQKKKGKKSIFTSTLHLDKHFICHFTFAHGALHFNHFYSKEMVH